MNVTPDRIQSHGLDLSGVLKPSGTGLVWTAVEEGTPIAQCARVEDARRQADRPREPRAGHQPRDLVKDSPQNTLVFVTRLDTAAPVAGARVSIVMPDGKALWTGTTGADGVAIAPQTRLRDPRNWSEFAFIVTAEKDGDVAYVGSDWNDGILPWEYGINLDLEEADPLLRGTVFTDRGVYKLGEEVHFKAILRSNTPGGVRLLPDGTAGLHHRARQPQQGRRRAHGQGERLEHGGMDADGSARGRARELLRARHPRERSAEAAGAGDAGRRNARSATTREYKKSVTGSFLVAAYRRPDFRVDVTLTGDSPIAGDPLKGVVTARYLFGAPMGKRPTHWTFTRTPVYSAPVRDHREVSLGALDVRRLSRRTRPRASQARDGDRTMRR